jgi:8-oxo-dGTP pyrophosphatase MutT (NUDIX family)
MSNGIEDQDYNFSTMKWKVLESEYLHREEWLTVRKDKCQLPNGKIVPAFYVNEYPDWVNALGITKEGQVIMVKQYRHGIAEESIEVPGGVVEAGETWQDAVLREMMEETGYRFGKLEYLCRVSANPSTTNNFTHFFLATEGEKVAEQKLDDLEDVEVILMSIDELKQLVKENKIIQSLHLNCIFYGLARLDELSY